MNIDVIDSFKAFEDLKENFNFVYSADPNARFFMSWIWLSRVLKHYAERREPWFILAAKPDESSLNYVAFLPLKVELYEHNNSALYNQLSLVGVADADHIPCICLPDYEDEAISAFATCLHQRESWSAFRLDNVQPTDERLRRLLRQFSGSEFDIHEQRHFSDLDSIDNNIVPFVRLPNDWDEYLQTQLSSNSRQRIKRFLRKIEESDEYRITHVASDTLDRHIDILRTFWVSTWEGRKGADTCHKIFDYIEGTLRHCFEHNALFFPVLWKGDQPLGAIANILDHAQNTALFLVGGRDDTFKDIPSGTVLHADGIRYAIQHGFTLYDFLMGNETYKFSFGAQERHIRILTVQRKDFANLARPLDATTLSHALHIATVHHRANRLAEAEARYRQILITQPDYPDALYGLGVVLQRRGDDAAAETILKTLLEVQPQHAKAWFSLGTLYQTQGQLQAAETAYQQALATAPEASAILLAVYHNLGYTLQQQGKWDDAIACYETARTLQPENLEIEAIWANAMHAQGNLSADDCARCTSINHDLGNRRRKAGDLKVACEYYRQAIALQPDLAAAHYDLGLTLHMLGQWDEAIACYETARALQPDHPAAEANIASVRHAQGTLAPDQQTHYAALCLKLGDDAKQAEEFEVSIQFYQQAIALQPELATAYYHLGLALQNLGKWDEAIAHYQHELDRYPTDLDADLHLAALLHMLGKLPEEKQLHYAAINRDLGHHYQQTGNLSRAIEHYQQAIAMNPSLVETREQLRLALQDQHDVQIKVSCAKR